MNHFVLKGHVCYSKSKTELTAVENAYVVCVDGRSKGVYTQLPPE